MRLEGIGPEDLVWPQEEEIQPGVSLPVPLPQTPSLLEDPQEELEKVSVVILEI